MLIQAMERTARSGRFRVRSRSRRGAGRIVASTTKCSRNRIHAMKTMECAASRCFATVSIPMKSAIAVR